MLLVALYPSGSKPRLKTAAFISFHASVECMNPPDSMFDVFDFVPRVDGAAGPSGVVPPAVSGVVVDVRATVAQTAGP